MTTNFRLGRSAAARRSSGSMTGVAVDCTPYVIRFPAESVGNRITKPVRRLSKVKSACEAINRISYETIELSDTIVVHPRNEASKRVTVFSQGGCQGERGSAAFQPTIQASGTRADGVGRERERAVARAWDCAQLPLFVARPVSARWLCAAEAVRRRRRPWRWAISSTRRRPGMDGRHRGHRTS